MRVNVFKSHNSIHRRPLGTAHRRGSAGRSECSPAPFSFGYAGLAGVLKASFAPKKGGTPHGMSPFCPCLPGNASNSHPFRGCKSSSRLADRSGSVLYRPSGSVVDCVIRTSLLRDRHAPMLVPSPQGMVEGYHPGYLIVPPAYLGQFGL